MTRRIIFILFMMGPALSGPLDPHGLTGIIMLINEARRLDLQRRTGAGALTDELQSRNRVWNLFCLEISNIYRDRGYDAAIYEISVRRIFSPEGPLNGDTREQVRQRNQAIIRRIEEQGGPRFLVQGQTHPP